MLPLLRHFPASFKSAATRTACLHSSAPRNFRPPPFRFEQYVNDLGRSAPLGSRLHISYGIGWGSLLLINTAIAGLDGQNKILVAAASCFFGPLVTLYLAFTTSRHRHPSDLERRVWELERRS